MKSKRWHGRFTNTAGRRRKRLLDDVCVDFLRKVIGPDHFVIMEIGLGCSAVFIGHFAMQRQRHPHHCGTFHLAANTLRIGSEPAVNCRMHSRYRDLPINDFDMYTAGHIGNERLVNGKSQAFPVGIGRPQPASLAARLRTFLIRLVSIG